MGIDSASLTNAQRKLMDESDRQELGLELPGESKVHQRMIKRLERDEQNVLVAWLSLREEAGTLTYDWSRTDRKTTNRKGMPDFRLYARGRVLLGEMKVGAGSLSPDQIEMMEKFSRTGTEVQVWRSAAEGIEAIRDWLISL